MKVWADIARCEGHGQCAAVAPEIFELDDDAVVRIVADDVPASAREQARAAVEACPVAAFGMQDDDADGL